MSNYNFETRLTNQIAPFVHHAMPRKNMLIVATYNDSKTFSELFFSLIMEASPHLIVRITLDADGVDIRW